jgi:hypothetical protein
MALAAVAAAAAARIIDSLTTPRLETSIFIDEIETKKTLSA